MPPKRKKTEPCKPKPPTHVRRSTRISGVAAGEDDAIVPHIPTAENADSDRVAEPQESREAFERTIRDLGEIGLKLQSAVKRQRLAVESSNLSRYDDERAREKALQTGPPKGAKTQRGAKNEAVVNGTGQTTVAKLKAEIVDIEIERDAIEATEETVAVEALERSAKRPPPVNSHKLPLPWNGRLGYACLNTYLRTANPPVFSSRTCRIASIIEHQYPLQDPTQPEHPTKNRPDKTQPPDLQRGLKYVQELGLANARDIVKMLRWNDKYGIKFMRLSSEMFPFASHEEYGYKLAPFAAEVLAEAGKVAAELGHRLTTHPGQFTQIASPRKEVVTAAVRDLEYHEELLSLLKLPEQMNRDAVMILHMGGTFGDKAATLDRFRKNYIKLSDGVKMRLVLENDDVSWSVHDLLPICEELSIPLVLDFHHHNIVFDPSIREGTLEIIDLYDRIRRTWTEKNVRQKMHYSEPTADAITPRDRRKHSARVKTLPPCVPDMDLMIEAKDKEQAVFDLMRTFKLPGWDLFNNLVPFEREDEIQKQAVKKAKKTKKGKQENDEEEEIAEKTIDPEEFGMGGPQNRVYWPEGMEDWLRPRKREVKKSKKTAVAD